jgi:hypothetical protein
MIDGISARGADERGGGLPRDGKTVLRLYVRSWQFDTDDPESAGKDAVEKYRLSVGEGDVVEVVETVQVWSADR